MPVAATHTVGEVPPSPEGAVVAVLPGNRLHLQHGPIDLIIKAWGTEQAVSFAYRRAQLRFSTVLHELVAELPLLRRVVDVGNSPGGTTALRMWRAARQFASEFITPMAAVAGSVADEILSVMNTVDGLNRAYVNNGGDVALLLRTEEAIQVELIPDAARSALRTDVPVVADLGRRHGIGGVATSGWLGRSHSFGIADAVTVFADNAATADAAATLIANAVNVDSPAIARAPACELDPDSDLGERQITVNVAPLSARERVHALNAGAVCAERYLTSGLIKAAYIHLQGDAKLIEHDSSRVGEIRFDVSKIRISCDISDPIHSKRH